MAWTTPRTWTNPEVVTDTIMNTHVRDQFNVIGGAWTAYTPTITTGGSPITLGNGTIDAAYKQIDKTIFFRVTLAIGSTTGLPAGTILVGLPVNAKSSTNGHAVGTYVVASPNGEGSWKNNAANTVQLFNGATLQTVATLGLTTSTVLYLNGTYEGA